MPNKLIAKSRCRDFAIVDTVKAVLAKRLNVPPETTVLTYNDEILANDMKIRDVKFTKDGVFKLEPYKPKSPIKKINIKIENSGIAKVRFNEKATIGKAKEKLAQFLNCEPQNISLLVNDPSINDQSLLKDVEIESEGTLDASLSPSKAPSSPVKTISIRLSNGLIAKGRYTESATIKKMKEVLAKTLNTSPEYLSVIKNDPDESLIKDINEYSDADLSVQIDDEYLRPVTFLMSDGKKVNAHFKNSAKIGRIKEILAKTLNVVPERIIFNFSRKVGNNEQLKNLPIDEDGIISTTISSFAKKQTKEFSDSEPEYNYSAEDEFIEEEEEEEINDSRFVDNENVNQKESQKDNDIEKGSENESIHDYDAEEEGRNNYSEEIPSGSPAHSLILRTQNGQVAKTRFKDTATVGKVKDKMAEVLDANPANMSLSFDSKILDDNSFVKDVAPPEGVLLLKQSPTKLKVVKPLILKLEDGTEIKSRFRMVTTIEKVKETLGNILNYDPGRLVCYYEDEALANDLFLSEINIHDNECIYVSKE
ncbi:hypothetical protein TRFO_28372 [Tritrichomonas foetus]|uniref:Ubiquitin-like domain-containing protein n=1 Tax=Tritrichomonas foetus TaxID=1144522 RepID=A0A1J4JYG3_9EUKA|nr:hypothetical protein TRFO_28372 [Tritrichomonas foetus]|eukprot:OHT04199.1 hypothetical protein TRFO_28372 [Tritrichomonas foetus]